VPRERLPLLGSRRPYWRRLDHGFDDALSHWVLITWTLLATLVVGTNTVNAETMGDLKARCDQLVAYYDWYGASRSENTDGSRNMADMDAKLDCEQGRYEQGIAAMEDLLKRKRLPIPAPGQSAHP